MQAGRTSVDGAAWASWREEPVSVLCETMTSLIMRPE